MGFLIIRHAGYRQALLLYFLILKLLPIFGLPGHSITTFASPNANIHSLVKQTDTHPIVYLAMRIYIHVPLNSKKKKSTASSHPLHAVTKIYIKKKEKKTRVHTERAGETRWKSRSERKTIGAFGDRRVTSASVASRCMFYCLPIPRQKKRVSSFSLMIKFSRAAQRFP